MRSDSKHTNVVTGLRELVSRRRQAKTVSLPETDFIFSSSQIISINTPLPGHPRESVIDSGGLDCHPASARLEKV